MPSARRTPGKRRHDNFLRTWQGNISPPNRSYPDFTDRTTISIQGLVSRSFPALQVLGGGLFPDNENSEAPGAGDINPQ